MLVKESIAVDKECYFGRKLVKVRATIEGRTEPQYFFISDLVADNGMAEIQDVVNANTR